MRKNKWLWILLAILSIVMITTAACNEFYLTDEPAAPATQQSTSAPNDEGLLPLIESFTISPNPATEGQAITISWNITDASSVMIKPEIGTVDKVDTNGTKQLTPSRSMTYTLIATNAFGTVTSARTVKLVPPPGIPDLVITHMWTTGAIMYFNVKNQGTGTSGKCTAHLYLNEVHVATAYIQPLVPGEERIEEFPEYVVPNSPIMAAYNMPEFLMNFRTCIDAENQVTESDESNNNCMELNLRNGRGIPPWWKEITPRPSQLDYNIFPDIQTSFTTQ